MPQADVSDFYMYQCYEPGRQDYTCFILDAQGVQAPFAGPNYFTLSDFHFYEIYIDQNGDGYEDITFQFYMGAELGGAVVDVPYESDDSDDCIVKQHPRSDIPLPLYTQGHGGLTVSVGGKNIPIALKFLGSISVADNSNLNWFEYYYINYITGDRTYGTRTPITNPRTGNNQFIKPFDYAGTKTFGQPSDYEAYAEQYVYNISIPGCSTTGRVFVGQRSDPFAIALGAIFDLVNFIPVTGLPGGVPQNDSQNDLATFNVDSYILEIPTSCLVVEGQKGVIGAWTGIRQLKHEGNDHVPGKQISRLGNPLVNELLVGLKDKGRFNVISPLQDIGFLDLYINYPSFPEILSILFLDGVNELTGSSYTTLAPTNFPRQDLYAIFFTGLAGINQPPNVVPAEMMRLNTTIPVTPQGSQNSLGVIAGDAAGYPNGRRPADDTVDITLQAAMGRLCFLGLYCQSADAPVGGVDFTDGVPSSASDFYNYFPYLTTPTPGSTGL